MTELYTEIEIDATAEKIWLLLMNFENYPNWNPFIRSIEGEAKPGASLKVLLQPGGASGMTMKPGVVECVPNVKFSWLGSLLVKGLFDGKHEFLLEPMGDDKTRFVQRENFSGILVPLVWALIKNNTRRGFAEMNAALKTEAEKS